jgi:hypothetical protein
MTPSALTIQEQHMIRPTGATAFAMRVVALEAENAEYRALLRELLVQLCENPGIREDGNAPGHAHEVPGVWDSDNDELAGKPCAWCAVWARAVANGLVGSNAKVTGAAPEKG